MSDRIASLILQLILAIFLIVYGIAGMLGKNKLQATLKDEPFAGYHNLEDCIRHNWNKRDPEQYCRAIRSKVACMHAAKKKRI